MSLNRLERNPNTLKQNLREYGESKFLTIALDTSLSGAIALMNQHRSSCLLVKSKHKLVGIFTERDLVKLIAADLDFAGKTVGEMMTKQPIVLSSLDELSPIEVMGVFQQHKIRHIPLVDGDGQAVGLITHTSLRKNIQSGYLLRQKKVGEVMNRRVITTTGDRNLSQIAKLLTERHVSCVVIVEDDRGEKLLPLGIVTERDLVQFKALNLDLYHLPVSQVMSSPLFPVSTDTSLQDAHDLMFKLHIRRLIVTDKEGVLVGIITQTNILKSLNIHEIYKVLGFLEDLVEKQTKQLKAEREIEIEQRQKLEQKDRYCKAILANIDEIVSIVNPHNLEVLVLSEDSLGNDREACPWEVHRNDLIVETRAQFYKKETSQTFFAISQKAIATGQQVDFEYTLTLPNREKLRFAAKVYPSQKYDTIWIAKNITRSHQQKVARQTEEIEPNPELKTANRLLQDQIAHLLGFSSSFNSYRQNSWLQYLLPLDNKLGNLLRQIQRRNYPTWTGAIFTLAIAIIIEFYRRAGIIVPVPFMLLIISVSTSASLGGVVAGLWSHLVWSLFVAYAAIVGFGPQTLTGGNVQVTAGIVVMGVFAVVLGWSKEQNFWLTNLLKHQNSRLHQEIAFRTKDLAIANTSLRVEIQERIAAQKALANSEQKFRTIFERAEVGIVVAGLDKKLLQVNPKFCQFVGYSAEELQTMTFAQISHPDEELSDNHHVLKMRNSKLDTLIKEKRYSHKNGFTVWGSITATAVKNSLGKPEYFIAIIQEITKRKQAELALEESEIRFHSLLNACPFLVWTSGVNGLCNFFNTSWLDFSGRTLQQELGMGWLEGVNPKDRDFCLNVYKTAFDRKERFEMEYRLRQRNGKYAWILDRGMPRFKADGSFAGYIGTCIDINDRIKAKQEKEQLLQKIDRERNFLESVLQQMPAGVVIVESPSGKILLNNERAINIIKYSQLPNINRITDYEQIKTWHYNGTIRNSNEFAILKALKGEVTSGEELNLLCGDGIKRTLFANAAPIRDEKSNIVAAVATFYDITELKKAQAAQKDAENKSVLLKEIHHRIKNNLQIVSALLDLQSEQIQDKNAIILLEKSQARIQTMALIHEKLYSSKNLEQIDFVEYITSLIGYLKSSFIRDTQRIKLTLEIEPIHLTLDLATPCGLIVNELVVNSLEHGFIDRIEGEINIAFGRNGDRSYYLNVRDNGRGISQEIDIINDTQYLGLSLVRSLAEKQLKGSCNIEQKKGCVIKITFPTT